MERRRHRVPLVLLLGLASCAPVNDGTGDILDANLIGTWYRDDDSSGTDTDFDERMIFSADGGMINGDFQDPDGAGIEPAQWLDYDLGHTWSNGYYHDYSGNAAPNNSISGSVLLTDGSSAPFLLFQYRYSTYPNFIEVLTPNAYVGTWEKK